MLGWRNGNFQEARHCSRLIKGCSVAFPGIDERPRASLPESALEVQPQGRPYRYVVKIITVNSKGTMPGDSNNSIISTPFGLTPCGFLSLLVGIPQPVQGVANMLSIFRSGITEWIDKGALCHGVGGRLSGPQVVLGEIMFHFLFGGQCDPVACTVLSPDAVQFFA